MKHRCKLYFPLAALALASLSPLSQGASVTDTYSGPLPVTLTGTLPNQGTALEQTITVPSMSDLTVTTTSYTAGGFQTNLLLFDSLGAFVAAGTPAGSPDPSTGLAGDSILTAMNLAAGTYTVALADFLLNQSLTATNLSDGFTENFGNGTAFVDANGNTRSGNYALTIAATAGDPGAIPEPATWWLATPVLAWFGIRAGKRSLSGGKYIRF